MGKGKGSGADFDAVFREHYPRLVRSLSAAGDDAADVVQEAFVQALLRWRTVGSYDDPVGWVRHVAVRRMLNEHRSRRRRNAAEERLARFGGGTCTAEVDAEAVRDERITSVILSLSRQQRIAVVLRYYDDLAVATIADAMRISEGAVRYHLHEARSRLRGVLGSLDE